MTQRVRSSATGAISARYGVGLDKGKDCDRNSTLGPLSILQDDEMLWPRYEANHSIKERRFLVVLVFQLPKTRIAYEAFHK